MLIQLGEAETAVYFRTFERIGTFGEGDALHLVSGKIYTEQHRRNFDIKDDILRVENDPVDESRLNLTINRKPIADWFREQWHRFRYGTRLPQQEEKKSRGFKL